MKSYSILLLLLLLLLLILILLRTKAGKNRLVRNILKVIARVNVPRNSMTDSRKTSGIESVIFELPQASPSRLQPSSRHRSSVTQRRFTSTRCGLSAVRQLVSSESTHSILHQYTIRCSSSSSNSSSSSMVPYIVSQRTKQKNQLSIYMGSPT